MEEILNQSEAKSSECVALKRTIVELQREVQSKEDSVNLLKDTVAALQDQLQKLGSVQETLAFQTKELEHTKKELALSQKTAAEAKTSIRRLERLHAEAVDQREKLSKTETAESGRLHSKLDAVNRELDGQIRERARAESELDRTSHLLDASDARCRQLEDKLNATAAELANEKNARAADAQANELQLVALQSENRRKYEELDLRRRAELVEIRGKQAVENQTLESAHRRLEEEAEKCRAAEARAESLLKKLENASLEARSAARERDQLKDSLRLSGERMEAEKRVALNAQKAAFDEKVRVLQREVESAGVQAKESAILSFAKRDGTPKCHTYVSS